MLVIGVDHAAPAADGDALLLLAIPVLWIVGVVVLVAFKFRTR